MISRDFRPRLDMGKMHTNIIMTQIRAQKQKKCIKIIEPVLTPTKTHYGKRHFDQNLYRVTDITNSINNEENRSLSKGKGKRTYSRSFSPTPVQSARSKSGKKLFDYNLLKQSAISPLLIHKKKAPKQIQVPKNNFGKRRFDYSPNNQQRQSAHSPLNWSHNFF